MKKITLYWMRRDLRTHDNHGLFRALKEYKQVMPIFIFDSNILDDLDNPRDLRLTFIYQALTEVHQQLQQWGSGLSLFLGKPIDVFKQLLEDYDVEAVVTNRDYEPYARQRDKSIYQTLLSHDITFRGFKDQVIFEKAEVVKDDGKPYTVFTPFMRKWKSAFSIEQHTQNYDISSLVDHFIPLKSQPLPALSSFGFEEVDFDFPNKSWRDDLIRNYHQSRDIPNINGTSRLGVHLRFGTISIRELVRETHHLNETFISELIWRDFYQMILFHFPQVVNESFRKKYDYIEWRNNESEFSLWCQGKTGYPIVDAGMRELVQSGYMHNRVRMITASFLTKHLLIDWRWGETFFAKHLLDYDLAANNGGWQWAAGTGCDAAPYFRVFNPYLQTKKFDPEEKYIKRWVPEYGTDSYPEPMVEHKMARVRAIETYKAGLAKSEQK